MKHLIKKQKLDAEKYFEKVIFMSRRFCNANDHSRFLIQAIFLLKKINKNSKMSILKRVIKIISLLYI